MQSVALFLVLLCELSGSRQVVSQPAFSLWNELRVSDTDKWCHKPVKEDSLLDTAAMSHLLLSSPLCFLLLLRFPLASTSTSEGDKVVLTSSGPIKGMRLRVGPGSVTAYLGIRYAEPPLGKLRFQKPLPHQPWSDVLEATSFGDSCPQFVFSDFPGAELYAPNTPQSENCLFLNIWVPHPQPSSPVPVLFWIHGGGYLSGTGSLDMYNGASLAAAENVIVVTINYRLGALGFLFLPPAAPGNMGLWDQQLALKWVKENAAAFGGDPARVTLFGQSDGGASVNFHLFSEKSQDLFAQAVIQSGTANAFWAWRSPEEAKEKSLTFGRLLGCSEDDDNSVVSCLQAKEASDLVRYEISMYQNSSSGMDFPFRPTTDGDFLMGEPQSLMEEGHLQVKPILLGMTSDEASSFVPYFFPGTNHSLIKQDQFMKAIKMLFPNAAEDFVQAIARKYSEGNDGPTQYRSAMSQLYTDHIIACPTTEFAAKIKKAGNPIYGYFFSHRPSSSAWPEWVGAIHGSEIPYVFGTFSSVMDGNLTYTEAEATLSRRMMRYWAEFARSGNPTGSGAAKLEWPLYNATEHNFFLLSTDPSEKMEEPPVRHCDLLKGHPLDALEPGKSE